MLVVKALDAMTIKITLEVILRGIAVKIGTHASIVVNKVIYRLNVATGRDI